MNPYQKWLGINPKDQPPNHYRLLGIDPYESDADVIAGAADQRMTYVRQFQNGEHASLSQRILNEIAAAKIVLLNPEKKEAYDFELKRVLPVAIPIATPLVKKKVVKKRKPANTFNFGAIVMLTLIAAALIATLMNQETPTVLQPKIVQKEVVQPKIVTPEIVQIEPKVEPQPQEVVVPEITPELETVQFAGENEPAEEKPVLLEKPEEETNLKAEEPVNLLDPRELRKANWVGKWKLQDGLITPNSNQARISFANPVTVPYDLEIEVAPHVTTKEAFMIGLPVNDKQHACVIIDTARSEGWNSGLVQTVENRGEMRKGRTMSLTRPTKIVCQVRKGTIVVTCNEKEIVNWKGNFDTQVMTHPSWASPPSRVFVGSHQSLYKVTKVNLTPYSEKSE